MQRVRLKKSFRLTILSILTLSLLGDDFCHLLITFANSLDPDQDRQIICPQCPDLAGFIQASLCKIQGLFKDFSKTFLLFSRTENLRKILIYKLKFYF